MKYSQERKQAVLAKLAPPHQRTVRDVAAEEGMSPATLCHWRQQARLNGGLFPDDGADPEGWTARDKFTAAMETAALRRVRTRRVLPKALAETAALLTLSKKARALWGEGEDA